MSIDKADYERLVEIRGELKDLLEEAKNIVRMSCDRFIYERAKDYWINAIENALTGFGIAGDMDETIRVLKPDDIEDDEDEYGDDEDMEG